MNSAGLEVDSDFGLAIRFQTKLFCRVRAPSES
jgi:hypothetical protein